MANKAEQLSEKLTQLLSSQLATNTVNVNEVTVEVAAKDLLSVCKKLRDEASLGFEMLIDLCGVDYSKYGQDEWATDKSGTGFSRGVNVASHGHLRFGDEVPEIDSGRPRFAVVYHLLSVKNNWRLRVRVFADDEAMPVVPSVIDIWNVANWFEREAFDLFGIHFDGHPDLRRILTDYGFVGPSFPKRFSFVRQR